MTHAATVARSYEVELPVGLADASGDRRQRRAALRKMTGHEEALLYDPSLSAPRLVTELLRACLVRLGDDEHPSAEAIANLFTADRYYLLLALRRLSLGDRAEAAYACPGCRAAIATTEDLARLEVRRLPEGDSPEPVTVELEDGHVDRDGQRHARVTLRLPRGTDEEHVAPAIDADPLRARDALLVRCITSFGSLPRAALDAYGVKIVRGLTLADRRALFAAIDDAAPGVRFRRRVHCNACGAHFEAALRLHPFFELG